MLRVFRGVNEIFAITGCYTVYIGSYLPTFGTAWWPHLQGSSRPRRMPSISSWTFWPWTKGPLGYSETSVNVYQLRCVTSQKSEKSSDVFFYGEQLLGCRPPPRLEAHPLTAVLACLSKIFAATHHIYKPFRRVCVRAKLGFCSQGKSVGWRFSKIGCFSLRGSKWQGLDRVAWRGGSYCGQMEEECGTNEGETRAGFWLGNRRRS